MDQAHEVGATFTLAPALPILTIGDAVVTEGNCGTKNASFTVTLAPASAMTVKVRYATGGGTATAGEDYTTVDTPVPRTLAFDPGVVSQAVTVPVLGDMAFEGDETFTVTLSEPVNAAPADSEGLGTITNDDRQLLAAEQLVSWEERGWRQPVRGRPGEDGPVDRLERGASSTEAMVSGDGYAEFTVTAKPVYLMAGLSHGDTDTTYQDIDYEVYICGNGHAYALEGATQKWLGTYEVGDVFRSRSRATASGTGRTTS